MGDIFKCFESELEEMAESRETKLTPVLRREYGSPTKHFPCRVCAPLTTIPIYHRHHSTMFFHNTMAQRQEKSIDCPTCKENHPIDSDKKRLIVVFSTSCLHNTFLNNVVKTPFHINIETIAGGTIDLLRCNFAQLYWNVQIPMDVVAVAGLNDVQNLELDQLLDNIVLFKRNVLEQNKSNTFTMARLMRPPKYAWFPNNGPEPKPHYGKYINHLEKINDLNSLIDKLNKPNGHTGTLGFQNEGTRGHTKRDAEGNRITTYRHMFNQWREDRPELMLHLTEEKRAAMFMKLVKFIEMNIHRL